jgi:prepilin-type N-terminal cleavage/methylation domain-containing protein
MLANRKGFTLIELLIVVVIIGILAAIAIPKFSTTKEKAYVAAMKSDLRNLGTAQEAYFSDFNTYSASLPTDYTPSTGVTVVVGTVSGTGWAATSAHQNTTKTCAIAYGGAGTTEPICS